MSRIEINVHDGCEAASAMNLPSLGFLSDVIISQRDKALQDAREGARLLAEGFEMIRSATALGKLAAHGDIYWRYDHEKNRSYQSLFTDGFDPEAAVEAFRRSLDANIWQYLIRATGVRDLMDAKEARDLDRSLSSDVVEVSAENLRATFERLFKDSRLIFLRGLANVFVSFDKRFKSHDAFSVKTRIVYHGLYNENGNLSHGSYRSHGIDDLDRVLKTIAAGRPTAGSLSRELMEGRGRGWNPRQSYFENDQVRVRSFMNGNAHIYIQPDMLAQVNKLLAEYYGEVLPDGAPAGMTGQEFAKSGTNLPVKDLAFYPTPPAVAEAAIARLGLGKGARVLEPSAGSGGLVGPLLEAGYEVDAIEIHPSRCRQLRERYGAGCTIFEGNFLDHPATPIYKGVVLNPPFSAFDAHVRHAFDFLADGGVLVAILPAAAEVSETTRNLRFRRWIERVAVRDRWRDLFSDLPPESFADAGTRIQTVTLKLRKV